MEKQITPIKKAELTNEGQIEQNRNAEEYFILIFFLNK